MNKTAKKTLALLLATALTLVCAMTAFAADIDFGDGSGAPIANGGTVDHGTNTVTSNDGINNITGNGSGWSLHFTAQKAVVVVNGDVAVGGIKADNDLLITGGAKDELTSTGNSAPGIETGGGLLITGGVTVNAKGDDGQNGVVIASDLYIDDGTLTATGGGTATTTTKDGLNVGGVIEVGGVSQKKLAYAGKNSVTLTGHSSESRRTTMTYSFPHAGLRVGVTSDIGICVYSFNGTPVGSGSVTALWEGKWLFLDFSDAGARFPGAFEHGEPVRNLQYQWAMAVGNGKMNPVPGATTPKFSLEPSTDTSYSVCCTIWLAGDEANRVVTQRINVDGNRKLSVGGKEYLLLDH